VSDVALGRGSAIEQATERRVGSNVKILNVAQARRVDELAVDQLHFNSLQLMENAGRGAVDYLCDVGVNGPVLIACGKGNNAGDGYVMARHLVLRGYECCLLQCCDERELRGDAAHNFRIAQAIRVPVHALTSDDLDGQVARQLAGASWVVDALLGTGAQGAPRAPLDRVIQLLNEADACRMAVDISSGLNAETGQPAVTCFRADHTVTFVAAKSGLIADAARPYVGKMYVADIGLPLAAIADQFE